MLAHRDVCQPCRALLERVDNGFNYRRVAERRRARDILCVVRAVVLRSLWVVFCAVDAALSLRSLGEPVQVFLARRVDAAEDIGYEQAGRVVLVVDRVVVGALV